MIFVYILNIISIFIVIINFTINQTENITAPKVDAILSCSAIDNPSTSGATYSINMKRHYKRTNLPYCECGCGQQVTKVGNRYITHHNLIIAWNKGLTKETDERVMECSKSMKGRKCWAKGLTKETDIRLQKAGEKKKGKTAWNKGLTVEESEGLRRTVEASKGREPWNKGGTSWCKGLTKETNPIIKARSEKHSGKGHHSWLGGISFEPYSLEWTKTLKESIKKRDNYRCGNPWCKSNSTKLGVHHIDYNKKNCNPENLITLCNSCHTRTNHNRKAWQSFYKIIMEGILWRIQRKIN